jgi:putative nucleotidyltransferase with HDIG domain
MEEQKVLVDQLRTGLFIRLNLKWGEHPFFFSSFKIKSDEQIQILRELGLKEITYVPEKSDCQPLALPSKVTDSPPLIPDSTVANNEHLERLRKEQRERVREQRQRIQVCEKQYQATLTHVKKVMHSLTSGSKEAAKEADQLIQGLVSSITSDRETILHVMNIKTIDDTVYYHTLNVAILSLALAKEYGLDPEEMRALGLGALFHDIGKERIPKPLVHKRGPLTTPELKLLQLHPRYGVEMMTPVADFPRAALQVIHQHHEANDGKGYPDGLAAQDISFLAKVTAIANYYDNLCNRQDPKDSLTPHESLSFMFGKRQDKFDHSLLNLFIGCLGVFPPGTIVELNNGLIGMVVSINAGKPLQPSVLIYDPTVPKNEAIIFDLGSEADAKIDRSLRPSQLPPKVFAYLDPRVRVSYYFESGGAGSTVERIP